MKEYGSRMNLEILILHFENKNYFDVNLKQFAFEILQLLGYFLSWKRGYLLLCLAMRSSVKIHHEMTFCFKVKGSRKSSRFCLIKNLSLFLTFIFISMNNNEYFILDVMNLMKSILCILRALFIVLGYLLA